MAQKPCIALVAHDAKKDDLVAFASRQAETLGRFELVATGTTGGRIAQAVPELSVERLKSGPLGGDQQIGAMIANGDIEALIFLVDPLSPMPHDVDVKALMRLALVYNIPMALNLATAELLISTDRVSVAPTPRA
ncbi:MAG: methylglyoxal synthase [Pseudomonadota bacterium]